MSQELEKVICQTLEENPGAELKFTRRVRNPGAVIITMEIQGGGRWLQCPMSEDRALEEMPEPLHTLRRARANDRLVPGG